MPNLLDATGLQIKTQAEITESIKAKLLANISPDLDLTEVDGFGETLDAFSSELRQGYELLQSVCSNMDPDQAEGFAIRGIAAQNGTIAEPAKQSSDYLDLDLDAGDYLAGTLVVYPTGDPSARFSNASDILAHPGGILEEVLFLSEETGPVRANAGSLINIAEVVPGFNGVDDDPEDATLGALSESDTALRTRMDAELARGGSTSARAVRVQVDDVAGVTWCEVLENDSDVTDGNGLPPKSLEVIYAHDSSNPDVVQEVAATIWECKAGGIQPYGALSEDYTDDRNETHAVGYTLVTDVNMYLEVDVSAYSNVWSGKEAELQTLIQQGLADWGDANLGVGSDVIAWAVRSQVGVVAGGLQDVPALRLGNAPSPVSTTNYAIGPRSRADLDTSRILVNVTLV